MKEAEYRDNEHKRDAIRSPHPQELAVTNTNWKHLLENEKHVPEKRCGDDRSNASLLAPMWCRRQRCPQATALAESTGTRQMGGWWSRGGRMCSHGLGWWPAAYTSGGSSHWHLRAWAAVGRRTTLETTAPTDGVDGDGSEERPDSWPIGQRGIILAFRNLCRFHMSPIPNWFPALQWRRKPRTVKMREEAGDIL
jgi:hypothetical protein